MMKRVLKPACLALSAVVALLACSVPAYAAPTRKYEIVNTVIHNSKVDTLADELERKYGILIFYPFIVDSYNLTAAIFEETLRTLDAALETFTPQAVRLVSEHYRKKNGIPLSFYYSIKNLRERPSPEDEDEVQVAGFNPKNSCITLYIPRGNEPAIATGDSPMIVAHELGHAVQLMLADQYGMGKMEKRWTQFLEGAAYGEDSWSDRQFVTEYARFDFEEDFAETFAHVFICNRPGLGFSYKLTRSGQPTPLGKKVAYLEELLSLHLPDCEDMLSNLRKIYSTPSGLTFNGLKMSGFHLLFSGMPEPRTVPMMLLGALNIDEKNTIWIEEIGGWYCTNLFGSHYVLFPEGTFGSLSKSLLTPS